MDAVQRFKKRRIARMEQRYGKFHSVRCDADDEETNNRGGSSPRTTGHGNTRIPFGLCQREGIRIDPSWTPKDAWDALAGKGYSAESVYRQLKKNGKIGGGGSSDATLKRKRPPTKIEDKHFPDAMVKKPTYLKNTMEAVNFINSHCDDGNITEFLSMGKAPGGQYASQILCRKISSGEGCEVSTTYNTLTGQLYSTVVKIPLFSRCKTEEEKAQAIRSFAHEWTHFIDLSARNGGTYEHFSGQDKELRDLLDKENNGVNTADDVKNKIGDEVKDIFDKYNKRFDELEKEFQQKSSEVGLLLKKKLYGDKNVDWLDDKGSIRFTGDGYWAHRKEADEFMELVNKGRKELADSYKRKRRAAMDGVSNLQGIYDSIFGGKCRENGVVKWGHSLKYFTKDPGNRAIEALADYIALKATNPSLAEVFAKDKPEIAKALDNTIEAMTKKLKGV